MVRTFELAGGVARAVGTAPNLAEASAGLPSGAYTTLRTYGGDRLVRLELHLRRLEESAARQGHPARLKPEDVRRCISTVLQETNFPDSRLRLTLAPPRLFVSVEAFQPPDESLYRQGAWCVTVPLRRPQPEAKDTRFLAEAQGAYAGLPPGAHEGLLVAEDGTILEGLSSNFFAVREGILHTEEGRALLGVTRSLVLEVARSVLPLATGPVRRDQLSEVSECFLTSVSRGILPVVRVDEVTIGRGRPGPFAFDLAGRLEALLAREAVPVGR